MNRKAIQLFLIALIITGITGCDEKITSDPSFDWFLYEGKDPIYEQLTIENDEYVNPIIAGFYPDPSIVRVDDDYYMVHSSFSYYPGIPIFHSKDLVNWNQIGNVLDRPSQLAVDSLGISRGVFAPTIEYHDGIFYVLTTLVDAGGNFMVTTKDPTDSWSDPIWLDRVGGIDPSIFFDDDGKVYVINNDAPEGQPLYQGHRAIWIREYDLETNKSISEPKVIINGGVDISTKPVWIEGPHLIKVNGEYVLHAAEGGTGPEHSQVVLKGNFPLGPFTPYPGNPILTQRHISPNREFSVEYVGHADMVETAAGEWWTIFLGVRPYDGNHFNTGRETFLLPVTWKDGWPIILEGETVVPVKLQKPDLPTQPKAEIPMNGNFSVLEEFESDNLADYWLRIRTPREDWYKINSDKGSLTIEARDHHISGLGQPSFIGRRQQHAFASASTKVKFKPEKNGDVAGLVALQGENFYYLLGITLNENGKEEIFLEKSEGDQVERIASRVLSQESVNEYYLKIDARGAVYDFSYAYTENDWQVLFEGADGTILSTNKAGGFVGTVIGMYAYEENK